MKIEIADNLIKKIWKSRTNKKQTIDQRIIELIMNGLNPKCQKCENRLECPNCYIKITKCSECSTPLICPECDEPEEEEEDCEEEY